MFRVNVVNNGIANRDSNSQKVYRVILNVSPNMINSDKL